LDQCLTFVFSWSSCICRLAQNPDPLPSADRATGDGCNTSSQPRIDQSPEPIGTGLVQPPPPALPNLPVETEPAKIEPEPVEDCSHSPTSKPDTDTFESKPDKDFSEPGVNKIEEPGKLPVIAEGIPYENLPQQSQAEVQVGCLELEPYARLGDPLDSVDPKVGLDPKMDSSVSLEFGRHLRVDPGLTEISGKNFGSDTPEVVDHDELGSGIRSDPGSNPGQETGSHFRSESIFSNYNVKE